MIAARAVGASKDFGDFRAVDDVDLSVEPGEVVALIGANGAGKTTLIKMLLGLVLPTAGTVELFGAPPTLDGRRRIGYVPQHLGLYADLTVTENLAFRAAVYHCGVDADVPAAATLVGDLPLGLQRRVAFAAALQHRPELLVLDEPTSGVSPLARSDLWGVIRDQSERGAGVLVSTHYLDEADQADRVVVMAHGRVVAGGTVAGVVGDRRAAVVTTDHWYEALEALEAAGRRPSLAGRSVRVLLGSGGVQPIAGVLTDAGIDADIDVRPATLDEAIVDFDR